VAGRAREFPDARAAGAGRRAVMAEIPKSFADVLEQKRAFASLATVGPDGGPQVTPVWFDYDGRHIRFNTARGRVKDRNLRSNPAVALAIVDPDNPYRYLQVRGRIVEVTETGADAHIDALAKKYLGQDRYPHRRPGEVRVTYKVQPDRVQTMG
jgi:PPOX class probable F420-dependent enzyme